jgi:hypothetical protein
MASKRHPRTTDRDVRFALLRHVKTLHQKETDTRIIEELGVEHGACRVDVAVINGRLHGYEIKSDADTLSRLPAQVEAYSRTFDRVTLVVGRRLLAAATRIVPHWWGISVADLDASSTVAIIKQRPDRSNPELSLFHLAHLLWRGELVNVYNAYCSGVDARRLNKLSLCRELAEAVPPDRLRALVRERLKHREGWRHHEQLLSHDD